MPAQLFKNLMKYLQSLLLLTLVFLPLASSAGGESWHFTIQKFSSYGDDEFRLELNPIVPSNVFPENCQTLVIAGEYASLFWLSRFGDGPKWSEHKAAIAVLEQAFKAGQPIKFGWMGEGIGKLDGRCNVVSRALTLEREVSGPAIYSYFKWP